MEKRKYLSRGTKAKSKEQCAYLVSCILVHSLSIVYLINNPLGFSV